MHGKQYQSPSLKTEPTSYYTRSSGIGRAIEALHPRRDPIRVGVIGLGAGTLASYGSKGDVYRFYDINPGVIAIAQRDFSYLKDSDATIELSLGDARLSLEREAPQQFDVLAIDAFSSDAIPVHLITREAVQVYLRHMKPDGIIAYHVTNRYLNLEPVVESIAHELGLHALWTRATIRWRTRRTGCSWPRTRRGSTTRPWSMPPPRSRRGAIGACGPMTSTIWCKC
jgi:SAM-dependent methyltransferase